MNSDSKHARLKQEVSVVSYQAYLDQVDYQVRYYKRTPGLMILVNWQILRVDPFESDGSLRTRPFSFRSFQEVSA